ncbi:GNAT family N-acetyltransferase [Wolbachia endosymbiont (group A) of Therophilus tumidulus]|uniref:GNAT family N-acetyltransferase n=1 Tax=Wolbachia endosymbiont (group A) of Therophilus tumidulus TaxID=3066214 RepID=UPI00376EEEC5
MKIRLLAASDIQEVVANFKKNKIAFYKNEFAGYITLKWCSQYRPFQDKNIPEIIDFNVLPNMRCRGIGSELLKIAEKAAAKKSNIVGLRVGLYADYGAAQKLYVKKG